MQIVLDRIEGAGGKILVPKMSIGQYGFIAVFIDAEGNRNSTAFRFLNEGLRALILPV